MRNMVISVVLQWINVPRINSYMRFVVSTLYILSSILVCSSCNNKHSTYFLSQPYVMVDNVDIQDKSPDNAILGGENYNAISAIVKDGLCVLYTPRNNSFYSILDTKTGNHLGEFGIKGNGPKESPSFGISHQIYEENGHIRTLFQDITNKQLMVCDITKTIEGGRSIYDTIIPCDLAHKYGRAMSYLSKIDDDKIFVSLCTTPQTHTGKVITPKFGVYSISKQTFLTEYKVFQDSISDFTAINKWDPYMPFSCKCTVNKSRNKAVIGMTAMPQINLLDITTGDLQCIRIKGCPNEDTNKNMVYYASIQSDEHYIYALYMNIDNDIAIDDYDKYPSELHIFDWNGNLIKRWRFNKFYNEISLDSNKLYAFKFYSGIIDAYSL